MFLTLIDLCFNKEQQRCHFESSIEQSAFGVISYVNKVYFDVSMHYRVLFNEDVFIDSLLNSGSMKEKLLFLPLNLVFRVRADAEEENPYIELE